MVEDFRFTDEGRSYRCWDQSGGVSTVPLEIAPTVICNAHWFVEVDGNQHRLFEQAMTTDKRLATKRACGVGSLTPSPESKPALKNRSIVTNFVTVRRGRQKRKSRQVRNFPTTPSLHAVCN